MNTVRPTPWQWLLLATPFYLNDFASIYITDWRLWLLIDYLAVKALPLVLAAWWLWSRRVSPAHIGLAVLPWRGVAAVFAAALVAGVLIDQNAYGLLAALPGYEPLGGMPVITSRGWDWFDLTVGLALVGLAEELVFRAWLAGVLRARQVPAAGIVAASAISFGLIHWSGGAHAVLVTGVIGAVFMSLYLWRPSLPALALAHFGVNFIDFAGVVPDSWFQIA